DEVEERLRGHGIKPVRREGVAESRWVLLDFVDVVVHVQHAEERAYYALERLWKDCPTIPFVDRAAPSAPADATATPGAAGRSPPQYADWLAGRPIRGRGGEEPGEVAHRALAALLDLPAAAVAVVVTHGGTAGRLVEALLGLGPEHRRMFGPLANCAWSELIQ